jgi:acetylornithine deacetylase/succinyl-diaminopimelate desuccinylase-like protein
MSGYKKMDDYLEKNLDQSLAELSTYVAQPSVSAQNLGLMGLGYPETKAHAPNENIRLDLYLKHAKHMAHVIKEFTK